ncbi:MAG TPA: hypothetical protein PKD79_00550 [Candidatus Doudnabacteria bacterium]|nr:hypothetical protein [Candidatus Doudnabacteria bacterium]
MDETTVESVPKSYNRFNVTLEDVEKLTPNSFCLTLGHQGASYVLYFFLKFTCQSNDRRRTFIRKKVKSAEFISSLYNNRPVDMPQIGVDQRPTLKSLRIGLEKLEEKNYFKRSNDLVSYLQPTVELREYLQKFFCNKSLSAKVG